MWDGLGWNRNPSQGGMGWMEKESYPRWYGMDGWRRNPPQVMWDGQGALLPHVAAQGKKKPQLRRISSELSAQSPAGRMGALHPC